MSACPPAQWVLAHLQCVELCERDIVTAAGLLPQRGLRSGGVRTQTPPRRRRRAAAAPLPPAGQEEEEEEKEEYWTGGPFLPSSSPPPTPQPWLSPSLSPPFEGFGNGEEDDEEYFGGVELGSGPSPSPSPLLSRRSPLLSPVSDLKPEVGSQEYHQWRASAPTTRLPWVPEPGVPKTAARWKHREQGRWYYISEAGYEARGKDARAVSDNIGLIMETTLGEQRFGDQRCQHCQGGDTECWVYTDLAMTMVKYASRTCARCREVAIKGGCSLGTRKKVSTVQHPPPRQQQLAPMPLLSFDFGGCGGFV